MNWSYARSWVMRRPLTVVSLLCLGVAAAGAQSAPAPLEITTRTLPVFVAGESYNVQLQARGGTRPYLWTVRGKLPTGVQATPAGLIYGIPAASPPSRLQIEVRDSSSPNQHASIEFEVRSLQPLTIEWKQGPAVQNGGIEGRVAVANHAREPFDLTVIIVAVNETGRATALGYQHFNLPAQTLEQVIPFGSTLPAGKYIVHADAIAEIAATNTIHRARQQTPAPLVVGP